ncbi:hypothetical protein BDV32DRAFT_21130 [Aspergillus pseudonomiae]|uniref:Uncharacterized protein n=1 Tax=Aspergillus pseudonomiae TaxID=1506151 RepID=A0A5N7CW77_9EURO|nr:uncharacterized protein BDV37DRAFT_31533 [Aspergillus pseudonomiae]KAB8262610.1 hypothetical protein BDV32DRAFT_21130 [Aspergillus pseudonomiae]KAE8398456.1 hypothetical protein BDV37DRAFT_31533 [Aspergillus pseudonomiae]
MTTPSQNPPWVFNKAVIVHSPGLDVSCRASLRIFHDKTAGRGSITLSITADLANPRVRAQVRLNIPPERVEKCTLHKTSNDGLCSPSLVPTIPAHVTNVSAVSTLSLTLGTIGIVFCPSETESLSPATPADLNFHSFAKICRSESLRIHFARRQCVNKELDKLESFCQALRGRSLEAEPFDHARHRMVQRDWHVFGLPSDPPPYCQEPVSEQVKQVGPPPYCEESVSEQVVRKRRRDSMPLDNEPRKIALLSSPASRGSPTEPDTPSTFRPSPPSPSLIRPTHFTRTLSPGRKERNRLADLVHEFSSLSEDQVREVLIASGHAHLLAMPNDVDSDLPSESASVSFAKGELIKSRRLERYIDKIIKRHISPIVDEIVDSAVSNSRDQFFDECKMNEAEFREQVDDGNSEVRNVANECINEMKEEAQKHIHEIEEQAQQCMNDIQNLGIEVEMLAERQIAKFKSWSNVSPRSVLDSKSSRHELGTDARRSSI